MHLDYRGEDEARFQKTLDRLRAEYEIMAKASVSTKLRYRGIFGGDERLPIRLPPLAR